MLHHSPTQTCLYKRLTDTKDLKLHQDLINRSKWRSRVEMKGHRVDHLYSDQVQPAHRTTTKPMRVAVSRGGAGEPPGVQPDSHLRGREQWKMLWSAFGLPILQFCSLLSIINGREMTAARLGSAWQAAAPPAAPPGSEAPAAVASYSRPRNDSWARAPVRQQALCCHSTVPASWFRIGSVTADSPDFTASFSRQKGRDCRKEGKGEEKARGAMGNVVLAGQSAVFSTA